jgi:hypothetical protein
MDDAKRQVMRPSFTLTTLMALLAIPTTALAADLPDAPHADLQADLVEPGYHLELAALDASALALGITGAWLASRDSTAVGNGLAIGGFAVYAYGGPVLHGVNKGTGHGLGSWGLRAGMPVAGAVIGYAAAGSCDESDEGFLGDCFLHGIGEMAIGFAVGIPVAMVLDNVLLAGPRTLEQPEARTPNPRVMVHLRDDSFGLTLGGAF